MTKLLSFFNRYQTIISSYIMSALILLVVAILKPGYTSLDHLKVISIDAAILGIVSLGQTFVILTGGIDLSIPWILTNAAFILTYLSGGDNSNLGLIIPVVLLISTLMGLFNGIGVAYLGISPIIMTLGSNIIFQGGLVGFSGGTPGGRSPEFVQYLILGKIGGLPVILLLWVLIIFVATVVLSKTPFGRQLYAVGNNEKVALFSGINVKFTKMIVYAASGFTAGLAGILFAGRLGQLYLGMGDEFQFQSITAVAIGGASLMGGSGSYIGTVAGAFTIIILSGLLSVFSLSTSVQQILYGLVLFIAVVFSKKRGKER
ncbi:MAG TPA: ABC transporter permease [Firmicutes bacterium]|jgi:ribose transport system permease protein|nr:ABC transporter permease [Bacillota bacterium]